MCRWMGSHFHDWTDYNGVAFSKELLEWGRTCSDFWGRDLFIFTVSKRTRIFVQSVKSTVFFTVGWGGGGQGGHNLPLPVPRSPASRTLLSLCLPTPALYCISPVIM